MAAFGVEKEKQFVRDQRAAQVAAKFLATPVMPIPAAGRKNVAIAVGTEQTAMQVVAPRAGHEIHGPRRVELVGGGRQQTAELEFLDGTGGQVLYHAAARPVGDAQAVNFDRRLITKPAE